MHWNVEYLPLNIEQSLSISIAFVLAIVYMCDDLCQIISMIWYPRYQIFTRRKLLLILPPAFVVKVLSANFLSHINDYIQDLYCIGKNNFCEIFLQYNML